MSKIYFFFFLVSANLNTVLTRNLTIFFFNSARHNSNNTLMPIVTIYYNNISSI